MSQCCSLIVLCIGGVAALTAMALVAIATNTDHWTHTMVDRGAVIDNKMEDSMEGQFYTRSRGLFRVCFPENERPQVGTPGLFLSLVEEWCFSREYEITSLLRGVWHPANMSHHGIVQLQLSRTTPCLLALYLFIMCIVGILGLSGCWNQSANKLIATAAFQLFAALVGACAMATWHAALFMEMEKVHEAGFPLTWPLWLQRSTSVGTGWSYILAWSGVCLTLLASLATSASSICLRAQRRDWEENTMRMKLKMSSMFAGHTFYPGDMSSSTTPLPEYINYGSDYPTMPANYPTKYRNIRSPMGSSRGNIAEEYPDQSAFVDYKKVVGQLENSKF
eukprot:GFUD01002398.1.p1 GENE.GFUD01002398.1~~GFUD01002398.1.p1  ORF type:complete len:335 (+),score=93.35 GFUD01002398.1:299-1303(+)